MFSFSKICNIGSAWIRNLKNEVAEEALYKKSGERIP
jgi:hypothetical protein